MTDSALTDLPEPDSPTMPSVEPASTHTKVHDRADDSVVRLERRSEVLDFEQGQSVNSAEGDERSPKSTNVSQRRREALPTACPSPRPFVRRFDPAPIVAAQAFLLVVWITSSTINRTAETTKTPGTCGSAAAVQGRGRFRPRRRGGRGLEAAAIGRA